jgi:hypothetical protein
MMHDRLFRWDHGIAALGLCCAIGFSLPGCARFGANAQPAWVDGTSAEYPAAQYLTGTGQADNRNGASDQAYAAVARIFKAEVAAQAKDWESYLVVESRGSSNTERKLTLDTVTKVSTDKVLENVRIMDTWYDARKGLHYALAGMSRSQAEASLLERMGTLDRAIEEDVSEARQTADKLTKIRDLRRATRNLVLREAYNADLRVIRTSGQGVPSAYRVHELTHQLEAFLSGSLVFAVQVSGDHAEALQRALIEGLLREGLHVVTEQTSVDSRSPEFVVRGAARLWPIDVRDPQFKYVRWCSDFEVIEVDRQRVVGAVARGGKEGHLNDREATAKAVRVMQHELSSELAKAIVAHIFGEAALASPSALSTGCPRENAHGTSHQ